MAQQPVESKAGELGPGNHESGLSSQDKQLPAAIKKTPLKDLRNENNIIAQKVSSNPLILKEVVITEAAKVSGTKRPSPESPVSPHQQSPSGNGSNGHLVYVRRKSEVEACKNSSNEVIIETSNSPLLRQLGHQEDKIQSKSMIKEAMMGIPSGKPYVPLSLGNSDNKTVFEEPRIQSVQDTVDKWNWEERYIQLQMVLKKLDQSNLEDYFQMLRSLSAVELSRHAVELEKRAIQLSLEQGKELQRVKALNVLGKPVRTSNGPRVQQPTVT